LEKENNNEQHEHKRTENVWIRIAGIGSVDENATARNFVYNLRRHLEDDDVLLLYAAKDPKCNHAIVLRDWLTERLPRTVVAGVSPRRGVE